MYEVLDGEVGFEKAVSGCGDVGFTGEGCFDDAFEEEEVEEDFWKLAAY